MKKIIFVLLAFISIPVTLVLYLMLLLPLLIIGLGASILAEDVDTLDDVFISSFRVVNELTLLTYIRKNLGYLK